MKARGMAGRVRAPAGCRGVDSSGTGQRPAIGHEAFPKREMTACSVGAGARWGRRMKRADEPRSGGKPRRRQRRADAAGFGPEVELGPGEGHDITSAGCGDVDVSLESAFLEDEALGSGRGVFVATVLGLLFLPFLDRFAHGTGVLAVESFLCAFDQAVLRGVVDDHVRPGDDLHHAPVAAAEMQAAEDGDEDAHDAVQGGGGVR